MYVFLAIAAIYSPMHSAETVWVRKNCRRKGAEGCNHRDCRGAFCPHLARLNAILPVRAERDLTAYPASPILASAGSAPTQKGCEMGRILLLLCFLAAGSAYAAEYMCKTADGKTLVQALPCPPMTTTTYSNTRPPATQAEHDARNRLRAERAQEEFEKREQERRRIYYERVAAEQQRQQQEEINRQVAAEQRQQWMLEELQRTRQDAAAARAAAEAAAAAGGAPRRRAINCVPNGIGGMVCN
ncbi:MAG: hypothetical protein XXXNARYT_003011 [Candidatus Accumulibacter regalis]